MRNTATATMPLGIDRLSSAQQIRDEIARTVPAYAGIEALREKGDAVQWGGPRLCEGGNFPTPDERARFTPAP